MKQHTHGNGSISYTVGTWDILRKVANVPCSDGKRRTVTITSISPDSFFSQAGSVHVKGKTVSGYITSDDNSEGYEFRAVKTGKNYDMLPNKER